MLKVYLVSRTSVPFLTHTRHAQYFIKCRTTVSTSFHWQIRRFANLSLQQRNYTCLLASGRWRNCLIQKNGIYRKAYKHMGVLEFADQSKFFATDWRWVQYQVIIFFRNWIIVIASAVIVLAWMTVLTEERNQKIDNLAILATCRSATSAMLSSTSNGPIAHGSTR